MMAMVAKRPPPPKVRVKVRTKTKEKQEEAKGKEEKEKEKKKEKKKKKKKKKQQVLYNALFANAGGARRIAFAIDLSGSMDAAAFGGMSRIDVVKKHLSQAIQSLQGVKDAAFGITTFTSTAEAPLGTALIPATPEGVTMGLNCIENMLNASGGNGGEPACLNLCLGMAPETIFFLGDGGWDAPALIQTAQGCSATIHSIAFFTSGGGLKEIAANSGGTYREIHNEDDLHSESDLHTAAAPSAASLHNPRFSGMTSMDALRDDCAAASHLCNKAFTESGNAEELPIPVAWSLRVSDREMSAAQTALLIAANGESADATSDMLAQFRANNHGHDDDDDDDDLQNHVAEIEHLVLHHDLFWHRVHHWTDQHDTLVEESIAKAQATLDSDRPSKISYVLDDLGDPNNMFGTMSATILSSQVRAIKEAAEALEAAEIAHNEHQTKCFELMLAAATDASANARVQMSESFKAIEEHAKSISAYSLEIGWTEGWKTVDGDEGFDMLKLHGFIASHFSDRTNRVSYCASTWVETAGFGHETGAEVLMLVFKPSARTYEKQLRKEHKAFVAREVRKQRDLINSEEQALRGAGQLVDDNYDEEGVSKGNPFTAFDDHDNDGNPDSAVKDLEGFGFEAEFGFEPAPQPQLWLRSKQKYRPEEVAEVHTLQLTVRAEKLRLEEFAREQAEAAKIRAEMKRLEDEQRERDAEAERERQAELDRKAAAEKAKKKVNKKGVLSLWGRKEVVEDVKPPPIKSNYMPAASVFAFGGRPLSFSGRNMAHVAQSSSTPVPAPGAAPAPAPAPAKTKKKKVHVMTWRKKKKKPGHVGQHQHVTTVKQPMREADQDNEDFEEIAVGEQLDVLQDLGDGTLMVGIHGKKHAIVPAYVIDEPQAAWKSRTTKRSPAKPRRNSLEIGMDFDMFAADLEKERAKEKIDVSEKWGFGQKDDEEEEV